MSAGLTTSAVARLRFLAQTRTDMADLAAMLAEHDRQEAVIAADALQAKLTRQAGETARRRDKERRRAEASAAERAADQADKLAGVQSEAVRVLRTLERLPRTHAAAALRIAETPDLGALRDLLGQPVDPRQETPVSLARRYAPISRAGDKLRALALMPGCESGAEGATERGIRLFLAEEDEIREEAEAAADRYRQAHAGFPREDKRRAEYLADIARMLAAADDEHTRHIPTIIRCQAEAADLAALLDAEIAERSCPRWWRKRIRREVRIAQAWGDTALRLTGPDSPAVSAYTLASCRSTWERAAEWSEEMSVLFADGTAVPLTKVQERARDARRAQLYTVMRAMEAEGERRGFQAFFVTLTLPGDYHSFSLGERDADGNYPEARLNPHWNPAYGPKAQWKELQKRWKRFRARLAKHVALRQWWGISVPEPHQNGTPHLHVMVWLPPAFEDTQGRIRQTAHVLRDVLRDLAPDRQGRLEIVRKRRLQDGRMVGASPASYVMKYVMMSLDDEATQAERGEDAERHRAWASSRGLRRMRLVGAHGSLRVWQRLWTAREGEYEAMPPTAQNGWDEMRRTEEMSDIAVMLAAADDEHTRHIPAIRRRQAQAAADALRAIGGLPGGTHRLSLGYEQTETEYGRPTTRPETVVEMVQETREEEWATPIRGLVRMRTVTEWVPTGAEMPLRRQEAELVRVPAPNSGPNTGAEERAAVAEQWAEIRERLGWHLQGKADEIRNPVTLAATCPSAGADAPAEAAGDVLIDATGTAYDAETDEIVDEIAPWRPPEPPPGYTEDPDRPADDDYVDMDEGAEAA